MKLTNEELLTIIEAHRADSLGVEDGQLSNERAEALDRYHGRLYGNEMEGRSSVVSKDLSEAVDWVMPAIMRIFTQSGTVAEFCPVSEEDEAQADLETDYVNQVIMKDNDGWLALHDAIKDTLLLKNGYVKHYWETTEKIEEPCYKGLVIEEVQKLMQDLQQDGCEVEIKGQEEGQIMTEQGPVAVFDLELKIKRTLGKCCVEAVPVEEVRVSRKCRGSLQTSPFVEHVTRKTRSDLIELGMDREFVDQLPAYEQRSDTGTQSFRRDSVNEENSYGGASFNDRSMDEIEFCEAYVRVDFDGDGIAELRKVVSVGNQIPDGKEWNMPIPAVALTGFVAKRIPHRHVGESLYDELGDIQAIKTTLTRQLLDNIYLVNNSQTAVNERVNLADFMTNLPGGVKRIEGIDPVGGAFMPIVTPSIGADIMPMLGYIDSIKESRTGVTKASAGLDPDTLSNVTKGAYMENMSRASQKVEMITRLIAETGVKEMVLQVHSILRRYQDKQRVMRMKGKYIAANPQEWLERTDLTVKVGLGTGTEEQRQQKLMAIAQLQEKLHPLGLVGPKQGYALFSDIAKTMGFDMPDKFAMNPDSPEYQQKMQQPQQPPLPVQLKQMEIQADVQKHQAETQMTRETEQIKADAKLQEIRANLELQAANDARDAEREMQKAQFNADQEAQRLEFDRWKAELEASTKLAIAKMQNQGSVELERTKQRPAIDAELIATSEGLRDGIVGQVRGLVTEFADAMGQVLDQNKAEILSMANAPKRIVRGPDGRAVGVEVNGQVRTIARGPDGRAEGIA